MKSVYWVAKYAADELGPGVRYERVADGSGNFVAATGRVLTAGQPSRPRRPVHFRIGIRVERYLGGCSEAEAHRLGQALAWLTSHRLTENKYDPRVEGEAVEIQITDDILEQQARSQ